MADVALTNIRHGDKDGKVTEVKAGESLPSGFSTEEQDGLKEAGALGDPVDALFAAQSTSAVLQAADYPPLEYTQPISEVESPSDEDRLRAHARRTDQVSRAQGKDAGDVAVKEADTIDKAEKKGNEASVKAAEKAK